jgi:hypothetical protein
MKKLVLIAMTLSSTACTSVQVKEVSATDPKTRVGLPYPLPFTQHRMLLTRQVVECGAKPKVLATAKIEETRNAPDPLHRYVIDPNSLSSIVKTSELKAEYHPNGLVKALNATAEDKTGEIIGNVAGIGVKIASLMAAPGSGGAAQEACKQSVIDALAKIKTQEPKLEHANKNVETATAALKAAKEKLVTLGASADETSKTALSTAYTALTNALDAQKKEAKALTELMKEVSHTETHYWPGNGDVGRGVFPFDQSVLKRWMSLDDDPSVAQEVKKLDIYVQLDPATEGGRALRTVKPEAGVKPAGLAATARDALNAKLGIPFRQPEIGHLQICSGGFCNAGGEQVAEHRGNILQLGYVYYLPCESKPFSSVACSFELTEDGSLKSMGTANKQAILAGGTDALESALESAGTIKKTLAEYRAAVKALDESPNAGAASETAALKAQIELAKAKKDLLTAEAELRSAQALLGVGS